MSSAKEIGTKIVALCKEGKNVEAVREFYADDVVSVEPAQGQAFDREVTGRDKVVEKNQWWMENHDIHTATVTGPWPHGDNRFALKFDYEVTSKPMNQRFKMDEIAVYTVENGKIIREEFFYDMG